MKWVIKLISVGILTSLIACGGGPKMAVIDEDRLAKVQTGKISTHYHLVSKKVNYLETLFRGLWLETKTSSMDISGLWNPDSAYATLVDQEFAKLNLANSQLVNSVADQTLIEAYQSALAKDYLANSAGEHPEIPGTYMPPLASYIQKYPSVAEFEPVRQQLLEHGVDYYFEYLGTDIYGNAVGYGMVVVSMPSQMRLIDLKTKEVIWSDLSWTHEVYQLGGDLKKLEENNLKILKEGLEIGVKELLDPVRIGPSFGVIPPKKG